MAHKYTIRKIVYVFLFNLIRHKITPEQIMSTEICSIEADLVKISGIDTPLLY